MPPPRKVSGILRLEFLFDPTLERLSATLQPPGEAA